MVKLITLVVSVLCSTLYGADKDDSGKAYKVKFKDGTEKSYPRKMLEKFEFIRSHADHFSDMEIDLSILPQYPDEAIKMLFDSYQDDSVPVSNLTQAIEYFKAAELMGVPKDKMFYPAQVIQQQIQSSSEFSSAPDAFLKKIIPTWSPEHQKILMKYLPLYPTDFFSLQYNMADQRAPMVSWHKNDNGFDEFAYFYENEMSVYNLNNSSSTNKTLLFNPIDTPDAISCDGRYFINNKITPAHRPNFFPFKNTCYIGGTGGPDAHPSSLEAHFRDKDYVSKLQPNIISVTASNNLFLTLLDNGFCALFQAYPQKKTIGAFFPEKKGDLLSAGSVCDNGLIALAQDPDATIELMKLNLEAKPITSEKKIIKNADTSKVNQIVISYNGLYLLWKNKINNKENSLIVWNVAEDKLVWKFFVPSDSQIVTSTSDENIFALSNADNTISLYAIASRDTVPFITLSGSSAPAGKQKICCHKNRVANNFGDIWNISYKPTLTLGSALALAAFRPGLTAEQHNTLKSYIESEEMSEDDRQYVQKVTAVFNSKMHPRLEKRLPAR